MCYMHMHMHMHMHMRVCLAYTPHSTHRTPSVQVLMTKGLAAARVGPASAMRSTNVLTAYVLQASLTPGEPVAPLSLCGALVITASISLILLYKAREKPPPPAASHQASGRQST